MRVRRDDAVRDGVAAVLDAVAQPHRDLVVAPAGVERLALLDLRAVGGEHPHRAEGDLDRLAEAQHHLARRLGRDRAALGRGALEQRVRVGGRGRGERDGERGEQDAGGADHQASAGSPPGPASRRRRIAKTPMQSRISTIAVPQISPVGRPPPGSGTQSSVPSIRPCAPPTVIGTFQSKMWAFASSS